jgi:hypothetical protein
MDEGVFLTTAPAVIAAGGEMDLFGRGSDNNLWTVHYDGAAWGTWRAWNHAGEEDGKLNSTVAAARLGSEVTLLAQASSGKLQVNAAESGWQELAKGLPECCSVTATGLTGVNRTDLEPYKNYSVSAATGYFWGDGRQQRW